MNEHLTNERLIDYLHGALPAEEDAFVHAHLTACTLCAENYEREATLTEALRAYARSTEREFPSSLRAAVLARRHAERRGWSMLIALRSWLVAAVAVPVAAAVAIGLFIAPHVMQPSVPSIDAAYYLNDHAEMNGTMPFADAMPALPASLVSADEGVDVRSVAIMPAVVTADDVR